MTYCFEIKAEQGIDVIPGSYFETAILADGDVLAGSKGRDEYNFNAMILPGKRIAGFGRQKCYDLNDLPAGLAPLEAAPSQELPLEKIGNPAVTIATNVILDQGLLAHNLCLCIVKNGSSLVEIPLSRPDVKIDWLRRGTFVITFDHM